MNNFLRGTIFSVFKKTKFETLPMRQGFYQVVNAGNFDGEKYFTNEYARRVQCILFEQSEMYTICEKIFDFEVEKLNELEAEGYLTRTLKRPKENSSLLAEKKSKKK